MRIEAYLVAAFMLAGAAAAQDVIRTPLPPEGLQVVQPGYSYRTPGAGWTMMGSLKPENGVVRGWEHFGMWAFERGRNGALLRVSLLNIQSPWYPSEGALQKYLRDNTGGPVVTETVNGAPCAVVRQVHDMRRRPSDPVGKTTEYWQVCSHPEMPSLAVEMRYETDPVSGVDPVDGELQQIVRSLAFTPLPYRVREIRPACAMNRSVDAEDALWVTCDAGDINTEHGKVLRIDPASNAVTATIPVGRSPGDIVFADGSLWVADALDQTVTRIDPHALSVVATIATSVPPANLWLVGEHLWLSDSGYGAIWADNTGRPEEKTELVRIDSKAGVEDKRLRFEKLLYGVSAGSQLLLETVRGGERLVLDESGTVVRHLRLKPTALVLRHDGHYLWLADDTEKGWVLQRFDLASPDAPPEFVRDLPDQPNGIAWWNGETCITTLQSVNCLPPDGNTVHEVPTPPPLFSDLHVVAGSLWVTGWNSGVVLRIDPK